MQFEDCPVMLEIVIIDRDLDNNRTQKKFHIHH